MYKFIDNNENGDISLHDRRAGKMRIDNGELCFEFEDGFFVSGRNGNNPLGKNAYSGRGEVVIKTVSGGEDDVTVYLFSQTEKENTAVRETVTAGRLKELLDGGMEIEFLYSYKGYRSVIFECWLWFGEEPYHRECVIVIQTDSMTYKWNELKEARDDEA